MSMTWHYLGDGVDVARVPNGLLFREGARTDGLNPCALQFVPCTREEINKFLQETTG